MKRKLRIPSLVLSLLLLLALLAGCAGTGPLSSGGAAPAETPVTGTEMPSPGAGEDTPSPDPEGSYTAPEDVAAYLRAYGCLPGNFITKSEARALGWESSQGNLWDVAPGMSIGGDSFGNREGLLPEGTYHECDVNYAGGFRGGERLVWSDDGDIYYTGDHYESFTLLYGEDTP